MKKLIYAAALAMAISCGEQAHEDNMPAGERMALIQELEKKSHSRAGDFDTSLALSLINNYGRYAEENPEDEESPSFLFRAADLCMALYKSERAIGYFQEIIDKYPDYEKRSYCMFLKAFTYEDQLKDLVSAKKSYNEFLTAYPDHEMADAAKFSIKNLGKSPEELIREFQSAGDSTPTAP